MSNTAWLKGFDEAEGTQSYNYLTAGEYLLEVKECTIGETKRDNTPFFAVKFDILESNNEMLPEGSSVSWLTKKGKFPAYYINNIKAFMMALFNEQDPTAITMNNIEEIISDEQPATGLKIRCIATQKLDKDGNISIYPNLKWLYVEPF